MVKAVLITLASAILVSSYYLAGAGRTAYETSEEQSKYEETIIAKEIATSARNSGISEVRRDFENWRESVGGRAYQGGNYDLLVTGPPEGPVEIEAVGRFGDAVHTINGLVVLSLGEFLDALAFDSEALDVDHNGNAFTISGIDVNPPSDGGGEGYGPDGHAVRAIRSAVQATVVSELPADRVYGVDGIGDVVAGVPPYVDLDDLFLETAAQGGTMFLQDTSFVGNVVFGSPSSPTVVKAMGDLYLGGNVKGYGVLYVRGNLEMIGNARWEGLVLVDRGAQEVSLQGHASIYGSVVVRGAPQADPGLPGGHFDVDVFDAPTVKEEYHEHEYDDKYDVTYVDLLKSGCGKKTGGGLCWDQIVGSGGYEALRVEFFNAASSDGNFVLKADGTTYTGSSESGFTTTFDPSTVTEFVVNFASLGAMSKTEPKNVQGDIVDRDAAFSVRLYDPSTETMVYELSVYWHYKEGDGKGGGGDPCGGGDEGKDKDKDKGGEEGGEESCGSGTPLSFSISGSSVIHYSSKALMRLRDLLPTIDDAIDVAVINERARASGL